MPANPNEKGQYPFYDPYDPDDPDDPDDGGAAVIGAPLPDDPDIGVLVPVGAAGEEIKDPDNDDGDNDGRRQRGSKRKRLRARTHRAWERLEKIVEVKWKDTIITDALVSATGDFMQTVVNIPQGSGECDRNGRQIVVKKISWRGWLANPQTWSEGGSADTGELIRLIVYLDKQCNKTGVSATTDILQVDNICSFKNLSNKDRFRTLLDKTVDLEFWLDGFGGGTLNTAKVEPFFFHHDCNIPINFSDISGDLDTIASANIGVLMISRLGAASIESILRIRYVG